MRRTAGNRRARTKKEGGQKRTDEDHTTGARRRRRPADNSDHKGGAGRREDGVPPEAGPAPRTKGRPLPRTPHALRLLPGRARGHAGMRIHSISLKQTTARPDASGSPVAVPAVIAATHVAGLTKETHSIGAGRASSSTNCIGTTVFRCGPVPNDPVRRSSYLVHCVSAGKPNWPLVGQSTLPKVRGVVRPINVIRRRSHADTFGWGRNALPSCGGSEETWELPLRTTPPLRAPVSGSP